MKEIEPLMIDLRVSFRTLRVFAASVLPAVAICGLSGCSGEATPASTAENSAAVSTNPKDAMKPVAKQAGPGDKGNLMPDIPKKAK